MRICLSCGAWGQSPLCDCCRAHLAPVGAVDQRGLRVFSGYRHESTARRLVHLLKYHAVVAAAAPLATAMIERMPADVSAIVPVPRASLRRFRFGVDGAAELAGRIARLTGIPVSAALRPWPWWPAHAGSDRASRAAPRFRPIADVPPGAILVDDVLTTGVTLTTAGELVGVNRALTATRASWSL